MPHAFQAALLAIVIAGLPIGGAQPMAAEVPVAPEHNPPGDIPDTQVFVTYRSPLGFSIRVPEGWARTDERSSVRFADKYNTIEVSISSEQEPPSAATVEAAQVPALVGMERSVKVAKVTDVKLKGGRAVLVVYRSNSDPNPVTTKQIRLEHDRYFLFKDGKLATIDLSAPSGADNVDDWSLMAQSFRWN